MSDKEYAKKVDELLRQMLPQVGKMCIDIGLINDLGIETDRRLKEDKE